MSKGEVKILLGKFTFPVEQEIKIIIETAFERNFMKQRENLER